jgi:hypothetical protein
MFTDQKKASQGPRMSRLVPPYDNGKVRIGYAYVWYQRDLLDSDMYDLQTALLGPRSSIRTTWSERLVAALSSLSLWRHK